MTFRIYCDFKDPIDDKRYSLNSAGSIEDIRSVENRLTPGAKVIFYQTNEMEVEGTIHRDPERGWIGIPDWTTRKFLS